MDLGHFQNILDSSEFVLFDLQSSLRGNEG